MDLRNMRPVGDGRVLVGWWCAHATFDESGEHPFSDGKPYELSMVFPRGWRDQPDFQRLYEEAKVKVGAHAKEHGCVPTETTRANFDIVAWSPEGHIVIRHALSVTVPDMRVWVGQRVCTPYEAVDGPVSWVPREDAP